MTLETLNKSSFKGGELMEKEKKDRKHVITKIPIEFEAIEQLDSRFMKIKVWILNIGRNYNGSIFTKDAVMKALPTISLTPILGYIEEEDGKKDFSDHRIVLEVNDDKGVRMKYLGSAYGVIPSDPNPQFELRENEFGGLEEYLTVEGLLWTKFDEAIDIMNRDTIKFQSMELSEEYNGYFNDDGYFIFTDFKFFGCCILGSGNEPAIPNSTIEQMFSAENEKISSIINSKLAEFKAKFEKKEDNKVHKKLMEEYGITSEQLEKAGVVDIEKYDIDEFKEELRKILDESKSDADKEKQKDQSNDNSDNQDRQDNKDNPQDQDRQDQNDKDFDKDGDNKDVDEKNDSSSKDSLSDDERKKNEKDSEKNKKDDSKDFERVDISSIKEDMEKIKKDYEKLVKDNQALVEYKQNKEKEEHQRAIELKISEFEALSEDDVKEIKENPQNFTVQEAEDKLFSILGRKQKDDNHVENKFAKFYVNNEKEVDATTAPSYDHYFTKHLKK
jgi:hypothetical protein